MSLGFISQDYDPLSAGFMADIYWEKASHRNHHEFFVRCSESGLMKCQIVLRTMTFTDMTRQIFYGNPVKNPKEFLGLAQHYNTSNIHSAQNAINVINEQSIIKDKCTSIYIISWGKNTINVVTPDGNPVTLGSYFEGALCIKDWRYVVRAANVNPDFVNLESILDKLIIRIPWTRTPNVRYMCYVGSSIYKRLKHFNHRGLNIREIPEIVDNEDIV